MTPAREYFGSQVVDGNDPSEQWNRKKQTKEQKRAAKKAKLDPANQKSALDVMREREALALKGKRKREEREGEVDGDGEMSAVDARGKRQKGEEDADTAEAKRREKAERRKEKRLKKKEKSAQKKAKAEVKKAQKLERAHADSRLEKAQTGTGEEEQKDADDADGEPDELPADIDQLDVSGLADRSEAADDGEEHAPASDISSAPTTPVVDSPEFDTATNHSAASSSSSLIPPSPVDQPNQSQTKPTIDTKSTSSTTADASTKPADPPSGIASPKIRLPDIDHAELQSRVQKRIAELRAARKADGPAKSRQELLDQRRKKGEQRKVAKKAQRQKAKEEEQRQREAQLRGSGSPLSAADIFTGSPRSPQPRENNFSFSRLAFEDGTSADPSLSILQDPRKKKGPQDPRTALQAAQSKQSRLAGYDASKRAEIGEKDMWLHAKQRAHGERVRDDTSLLKKALKRKEKAKGKSEREWQEREANVVKGREMRQKKREGNLAKRREEKKGGKGKGKGKGKSGGKGGAGKGGAGKSGAGRGGAGKKKQAGRPGFEGRFKA